jgi:hypothetical protein
LWQSLTFVSLMQEQAKTTSQLEVCCFARGETSLIDMIQELIYARSVDMLMVPTDTLGQQAKEAVGSLSLSLLRNVKDVSLLMVKANSAGNAHKSDILSGAQCVRECVELLAAYSVVLSEATTMLGAAPCACGIDGCAQRRARAGGTPINVMLEATATSGAMLRWVMAMLKPAKDTIFLARGTAFDPDHKLLPSAKRVFDTYRLQLTQGSFGFQLRPSEEANKTALAKVRLC